MGRQQAEAFAELELEQGLKAHLLGNFFPRHDVRLVDVAVESIKIYNEHKWDILAGDYTSLDIELPLVKDIQFRGKNTITPSECIEVLKLNAWLEECFEEMFIGEGE